MKLILEWLEDGKIPVMATTPGEICHYIHQEDYGKPLEWSKGRAGRRFPVQLFEERIDRFLKFLAKGLPVKDDVLYLPIRSCFELEGLEGINLIIGAALFPCEIPEPKPGFIMPYEHVVEGDLALIQRFCLLNREPDEPQEEVLRKPWVWMRTRHQAWVERQKLREESEARSLRLLLSCLDEEQKREMRETKRFKMFGRNGKKYLVTYRQHGNVWLLDENEKPVMNYCIVVEDVPIYDQMLSQKLLLEHDPISFFETANATTVKTNVESDDVEELFRPNELEPVQESSGLRR